MEMNEHIWNPRLSELKKCLPPRFEERAVNELLGPYKPSSHKSRILKTLRDHGPLTYLEIATLLKFSGDQVTRRLYELNKEDRVMRYSQDNEGRSKWWLKL